jgi:carboxyl-terminal processing protease
MGENRDSFTTYFRHEESVKTISMSRMRLGARRLFGLAVVSGLLVSGLLQAAQMQRDPNQAAKVLSRVLPQMHLSRKPFDDALAQAALDLYINMLDFDHTFFLQSDVDAFRRNASRLDDSLRDGDVELAFEIYDVLKARVSNRVEFVDRALKEGFDLNTSETYEWKRKNAPWPKDEKAWEELWRKKVQNEYVTRLVIARVSTNAQDTAAEPTPDGAEESPSDKKLSPEEQIRKAYRQYLTVLNDNDPEWVLEQYLTAFARAYDPHTDYMSKSNAEDFDIGMTLSLTGIGALLTTEDGAAKIERLIPGGPAEKDGRLKPGDKIIAVAQGDGEPVDVLHWPLSRTVRLIRGAKGSKVVLTVVRASDPTGGTIEKIDLIRDEVRLEEQAAKSEVREWRDEKTGQTYKFGVIYLPEFYSDAGTKKDGREAVRSSAKDVKRELQKLKAEKVQGVVLDLRNNGGGLLSEAIDTTGLFIDSGPVVQVQSRAGLRVLTDDDPECVYEGPLVVLVNRQTASASEILAGALQDYGRAIVVGDRKTHGKGTVQSLMTLRNDKPDLGTLKITTATFHRIDGASTQLRGIEPDISLPSVLDALEMGEESLPYALPWTRVYPSLYRRSAELNILMPEIKERAKERQEKEAQYRTYLKLVERISERQRSGSLPLNLEVRIKMAEEERQLQGLLKEMAASGGSEPDSKLAQDIVLQEGFRVLSDWVVFRQAAERLAASAQNPRGVDAVP